MKSIRSLSASLAVFACGAFLALTPAQAQEPNGGSHLIALRIVGRLPQCFPQPGDVDGEIVVLDSGVGPHLAHEGFLVDHFARVMDQRHENLEGLARECDRSPVPLQHSFANVRAERTELEDRSIGWGHGYRMSIIRREALGR